MTEQDIHNLIKQDEWMMKIITIASTLNLPDWVIGAGFVRSKIWNHLSGIENTTADITDIDLVYFDPNGNDEEADKKLSTKLQEETGIEWEVVNEFYANKWNGLSPYTSTEDAISKWPETATAVGVSMDKNGNLVLVAPHGISDLVNFIVRPSPVFKDRIDVIKERMEKKKWKERWPRITLVE